MLLPALKYGVSASRFMMIRYEEEVERIASSVDDDPFAQIREKVEASKMMNDGNFIKVLGECNCDLDEKTNEVEDRGVGGPDAVKEIAYLAMVEDVESVYREKHGSKETVV